MRVLGVFFGAALFVAFAVVTVAGCATGSDGAEPSTVAKPPPEEPGSLRGTRNKNKGWRWKGRADDCFFVQSNRCFSSLEKACKAARCSKDEACVKDNGAPAKVTCK